MEKKVFCWIFLLACFHAASTQDTLPAAAIITFPHIPNTSTPTAQDFISLALQMKITTFGEVSSVTIIALVEQVLRERLLNGTAHTATVTNIQRVKIGP